MAFTINGTTGISGVDGHSSTPAIQGSDSDTGIFFGTDQAAISTAGTQRVLVDGSNLNLNGSLSLTGNYVTNVVDLGQDNFTVDCSQGNYFIQNTNSSNNFVFNNVPTNAAYSFVLEIKHLSGTIGWPTEVKFPGNTAPQLTTGKTHIFVFVTDSGSTRFRGNALVDYDN